MDISMDFITGLPKSNGKEVILAVVYRLLKYGHFLALAHPHTTPSVAQVFVDEVYRLHGLPNNIASDWDPIFISTFWRELFDQLGVSLCMSSPIMLKLTTKPR